MFVCYEYFRSQPFSAVFSPNLKKGRGAGEPQNYLVQTPFLFLKNFSLLFFEKNFREKSPVILLFGDFFISLQPKLMINSKNLYFHIIKLRYRCETVAHLLYNLSLMSKHLIFRHFWAF